MFFTIWVTFWNISMIYFFFFWIQNIKSNCYIISKKIFSDHLFLMENLFHPNYIYLFIYFIKGLIFVILWRSLFISSWFDATVTAYWEHFLSFFVFYPIRRIRYIIHQYSDLFYDIYNAITEHNWDKFTAFHRFQIILIPILK